MRRVANKQAPYQGAALELSTITNTSVAAGANYLPASVHFSKVAATNIGGTNFVTLIDGSTNIVSVTGFTNAAANAGSAALPANPSGFLILYINQKKVKVPYYED